MIENIIGGHVSLRFAKNARNFSLKVFLSQIFLVLSFLVERF